MTIWFLDGNKVFKKCLAIVARHLLFYFSINLPFLIIYFFPKILNILTITYYMCNFSPSFRKNISKYCLMCIWFKFNFNWWFQSRVALRCTMKCLIFPCFLLMTNIQTHLFDRKVRLTSFIWSLSSTILTSHFMLFIKCCSWHVQYVTCF